MLYVLGPVGRSFLLVGSNRRRPSIHLVSRWIVWQLRTLDAVSIIPFNVLMKGDGLITVIVLSIAFFLIFIGRNTGESMKVEQYGYIVAIELILKVLEGYP